MPPVRHIETNFDYSQAPTLQRFAASDAFIRGVVGPVGSGKSSACAIEILVRGYQQKPQQDGVKRTRFAIIRQSYPQLEDTTIRTFMQWFPPLYFGTYTASNHTYIMRPQKDIEIEILFRALDRPDHVANLLSLELTGAWVNEAREISWPVIEALQGRLGRYPAQRDGGPTWFGVWMDTNPPDADSRWYKFFEETDHNPSQVICYHQPSGLSPQAENIPNLPGGRAYYDNLQVGKTQDWINVYIHGQYGFVAENKPVYPEYSDDAHCDKIGLQPIEGVPIHRGWDFGLTPAVALSQMLPGGRWLIFDEVTSEDMGVDRFSDVVLEQCATIFRRQPKWIDTGDPAGLSRQPTDEKTIFNMLQAKGISIEPGMQTLAIRLESVRKPLGRLVNGKPALALSPRCKMLRKGFLGAYHYRRIKVSGERFTDEPAKTIESHVHDGLQYTATRIFGESLLTAQAQKQQPRSNAGGYDGIETQYEEQDGRNDITGY